MELDDAGALRWASAAAQALVPDLAEGSVPAPLADALRELLAPGGGPPSTEVEAYLPSHPGRGQHLVVFAELLPSGTVLAVLSDVSWRKTVAHDLGNVVTRVRGFAELAMRHLEEGHPARDDLKVVTDAADEAWKLARELAEALPPR